MKHFLSLERLDVGRTLALTVGSPSAHRRGTMLRLLSVLVLVLTIGVGNVWGALTEEYSYTFTAQQFSDNSTAKTLGTITWTPSTSWKSGSGYWGYDGTKGQQWGSSGKNGLNTLTLTAGSSISNIRKITINASIASDGSCKLSVKVGNTTIGTEKTLTTTATSYDFESATSLTGAVQIKLYNNSVNKAQYIKSITIYTEEAPAYTITASSNNNSWGTVSVSGTTITATPADCYQVASGTSGYNKISGTGTITHTGNSNTISVTPTSNCSIQVIFEKKIVNTFIDEIQDNGEFEDCSTTAPSLSDKTAATTGTCAQQHWHFVGWVAEANKANPTAQNIVAGGSTIAVNGTTYYAVWAKGSSGGGFDNTTGGTFKIYADVSGTKHYAVGTGQKISSTTNAAEATEYTFEKQSAGVYYIKTGSDYIKYASSTNLGTQTGGYSWTITAATHGSWRVTSGTDSRAWIYRAGSTNQFGGYSTSNVNGTEYFDLEIGGGYTYTDYKAVCCTPLGSINGSVSVTQLTEGENAGKLQASWEAQSDKTGWAADGLIVQIYEDGNSTPVHTSSAISKNDLSYTATGFTPGYCTTYYATLTPQKADNTHCDGVESTEHTSVTTKGQYTYGVTLNGMQLKTGEVAEADNCSDFDAIYEPTGTNVLGLTAVSVTNAGAQGTGWTWNSSTGALHINKASVTGNVTITITGNKPEDPVVTPSTSSLNFGTDLKMGDDVPTYQTFTISGSNLTSALTVESSNTSLYIVSASVSLTPTEGEVSATITVTPQAGITASAGTKSANITISGGGLAADVVVVASMTVLQTYSISWVVNGGAAAGSPTTSVVAGNGITALPTSPTTDGCDDGKTFVGWTATAIANSTDTKPGDLFTTVVGAPAINADKTFYAVFATPGSEGEKETDVLTRATTGISNGGGYGTWSNKKATTDAVYAGKSAGSYDAIQLRTTDSNEGIVTTTSGGKAKKVTVVWNNNTASGRTINIYGKNSAYSAASDLYDNNKQGTSLGSIVYNTSTELTITGDYEYIGIRSSSSALYLTSISIEWQNGEDTPESGYITSCTKQVAVTATDGGTATIDGGSYVAWVDDATKMALVATPAEGYVFAGWTSTGATCVFGSESAASTTVITDGAATITANFVAGSTISANKENLNLVAYVDELDGATTVTFSSSNAPAEGGVYYSIEDWTDTENTFITSNKSYKYLSSSNFEETVTISYGSDVAGSFSANLVTTFLNKNSVTVGTKVIPITLTIKPKFTVTAVADDASHAIAVSALPNTDVKDGTTVTLSQTAADGWIFQKWTISYTLNAVAHNEDLVGNTFTMPAANVTATAVYAEETGEYLDAPTNAAAGSLTSHSAVLSWDAVEHASSYSVYVVGTDYEETFNGITETSYTVTGLKAGITYSWTVTAIGDGEDYYTSSAANGAGFTTTARILSSIAIKTNATKMTYNEGETFDKTGLEVTATYDDETTATISATNLVVPTTALTAGTTSITVSYTESGVTKEATLEGITITELYVVTWKVNNAPYGDPTYTTGAIGDLPANPSSACSSKYPYFVKWVIGDDPTADAVTPSTVIDGSVTINAVFAKTKTKTGYSSTAATEIVAGGEYIMGAQQLSDNTTMWYFSSYSSTDEDLSWGPMNTNTANAIVLTASGTTSSFQLKDGSNNYVSESETVKKFRMSSTTADLSMTDAGAIKSTTSTWLLRHNYNSGSGGLRWYDGTTGVAVYLYPAAYSYSDLTILCPVTYTAEVASEISNGGVGLKLQAEDDATTSISELEANTEVLLIANPVEGYEFDAWTVMQGESDITSTNVAGNVLTMPAGDVTISASFNKIAVESVTINGEANVQINNDVVWTLGITPEEARPTVVWSTANDAVATVNNGTVHGVAVGSTTITATVDDIPYNKTINVIAATVLNSISISTPQTEFTMGDAFVAPETVTANYIYEVGGGEAPSVDVTASATVSGYNMNVAGEQTVIVSYETKSYQYNINVAPWTLHLQTKRMYGNDEEKETVVDAEVITLEAPTDLTGYYVAGLCEGYTQLGYITSSEDIDALPNDLLTSYTPSANNETLYGVFQKVNYAGETYVDEDFSSATGSTEIDTDNYDWLNAESKVYNDSKMLKLGSKSSSGSMTTNTFDLSHDFVVKLKAKQYASDEKSIQVTVGSTTNSETSLTSSMVEYTFNFKAATSTSQVVITSPKRAYVESIKIYTLSDIAYMSVYDCREEKDVVYEIGNDKVVWTACENTTVMEGQSYTLCANEPSLQGYDFGGWIINGDEENVKAKGTTIEVAEDLTITPKFTEHVYDYSYALDATATNGTIASVTVNGVDKALNEVALHDGDAVVVTAVPNTNYELSEWTHSENVSLTTDANTASFTVAVGAGDMTIAAIFVEKAQYTLTLNVFGRTYTTKQGHEGDTYNSVLDNAQSPALTGYSFQGWSTDAENANAIISGEELLTADVTLYAIVGSLQPTGYVYNKVTSMEDVTADGYYLIVNESANKAFDGSRNTSADYDVNNNYVTVSVSENENQIISNATIDAAIVTIDEVPETEHHYIKTATGYYLGVPYDNGLNANKNTVYEHSLSFIEGNFVVDGLVQHDEKEMVLMFNSSAGLGRFGFYKGTQNPIQLYKRGDVHQEIIPEAEPAIEISTAVSASTSFPGGYVGDVTVVNGGSLNADINLSVGDLIIHSTLGKGTGTGNGSGNNPGSCGQIVNGNNITVTGDVYLELELTQDAKASAGWYAFSVPFPVDAMNGVYYGSTKLTNEVGYAIMSHYGELRAKDEYAWKKFRGIMQPGVFYAITVGNTDYKTLRFKKVKDEALVASTSVAVSPFPSQTGNNADGAWNGIGNPNLAISNLSTAVTLMQFYDHKTNTFIGRSHSVNLVVGSAFFIQYNATTSVSIPVGTTSNSGYLAPARTPKAIEEMIFEVQLNDENGHEADNVFLTAREDATNEYEIGHDVAKMSMGTAKCAQMWVPAYGTQLCAADFPLVNDKVTYPLAINAPSAGTYTISTTATENATLYLTKNGRIYWNLTMGECELDLNQGQNNEYGLVLRAEVPAVTTGIENGELLNGENGVQKVVIDEHVYILRGGEMYDMTGKMVK